jgi:hypothetical protein
MDTSVAPSRLGTALSTTALDRAIADGVDVQRHQAAQVDDPAEMPW